MKEKCHVAGRLVAILLLVIMLAGCATTQHSIEITNAQVSRLYIRNAGAASWGANIAGSMQDINRSLFSEMVDIRVVNAQGVVFSSFNVPFDDSAFVETEVIRSANMWAVAAGILGPLIVWGLVTRGGDY